MAHATILLIEDERNIVKLLRYTFGQEGYRVLTAENGDEGVSLAERSRPDLILLDLLLPKVDGFDVCRRLKQQPATRQIPVIMLTAKASEADKVTGLELGADDYVTKPFSPRELVARTRAVLRRRGHAPDAATPFRCGALEADWERHAVAVQGTPIRLTPKEFELLRVLADAKGRVLSREQLLERVWGYDRALELETRTVDVHVSQLRQKLRTEADRIVTVAGSGYQFVHEAAG